MYKGESTQKMIDLVGEKDFTHAMKIYKAIKDITPKDSMIDGVLTELGKVSKGLQGMKKKGYLTNAAEEKIYESILWNLEAYDKPSLLLGLVLVIYSDHKSGNKPQYALDTLVVLLKHSYDSKGSKKPFWEILETFLTAQGFCDGDEFKIRYHRLAKKQWKFLLNQRLLSTILDLQSFPKHERVKAIKDMLSASILRDFLNQKKK